MPQVPQTCPPNYHFSSFQISTRHNPAEHFPCFLQPTRGDPNTVAPPGRSVKLPFPGSSLTTCPQNVCVFTPAIASRWNALPQSSSPRTCKLSLQIHTKYCSVRSPLRKDRSHIHAYTDRECISNLAPMLFRVVGMFVLSKDCRFLEETMVTVTQLGIFY